MEKWIMFVLTHSANFNPRGMFVGCSDHFTDECFQRAVHVEGSQRSIIPLAIPIIWEKNPEKTRRKVPNLNAVEVIVCFRFNASTIVQNFFSFNVFENLFCLWKTLSVLPSASAKIFGVVLIKCILGECRTAAIKAVVCIA